MSNVDLLFLVLHVAAIAAILGTAMSRWLLSRDGFLEPKKRDEISFALAKNIELPAAILALATGLHMLMKLMKSFKGTDAGIPPFVHAKALFGVLVVLVAVGSFFVTRKAADKRAAGDDAGADKAAKVAKMHAILTIALGLVAVVIILGGKNGVFLNG